MRSWTRGALLIAGLAVIASVIGAILDPTRFFQSYLFSYLFWIDLSLGALPLVMTYHLTGGTWGAATRRIHEAMAGTIGWMAVLILPVFFGMSRIYSWMDPEVASNPKIAHKSMYLNAPSFIVRAVIYFIAWILLSHFLQRWSEAEEKGSDIETKARLRSLSAGGCVLYALTSTYASIDWQMSLEPLWYSTIYGMLYAAAQALAAYGFGLIFFRILSDRHGYSKLWPKKTLLDLGNLLLAIVMVWAYLAFMQYLVIWSGNLPEEVTWFIHRTQGGWQVLAILLIVVQFFGPFFLLLFRGVKNSTQGLALLGVIVFLMRIIDRYWMVMPGLYPNGIHFHWLDVSTWLAIGGIWLAVFLRRLESRPAFAPGDVDWPISKAQEVTAHV